MPRIGGLPTDPPRWKRALRALLAGLVLLVCVPILVLAVPFVAASELWDRLQRRRLAREVVGRWEGRRLLLVYSNSPVWKDYIETSWLPRIEDVAVVLNWSDRKRWQAEHPFEAQVFRRWAGALEFNPIAIAFMPRGQVDVIRFWRAFRDFKHGKPRRLRAAESRLDEVVAAIRAVS